MLEGLGDGRLGEDGFGLGPRERRGRGGRDVLPGQEGERVTGLGPAALALRVVQLALLRVEDRVERYVDERGDAGLDFGCGGVLSVHIHTHIYTFTFKEEDKDVPDLPTPILGAAAWSCRFAPTPGRSRTVLMPSFARTDFCPIPESWSSLGVWMAPPDTMTSRLTMTRWTGLLEEAAYYILGN